MDMGDDKKLRLKSERAWDLAYAKDPENFSRASYGIMVGVSEVILHD